MCACTSWLFSENEWSALSNLHMVCVLIWTVTAPCFLIGSTGNMVTCFFSRCPLDRRAFYFKTLLSNTVTVSKCYKCAFRISSFHCQFLWYISCGFVLFLFHSTTLCDCNLNESGCTLYFEFHCHPFTDLSLLGVMNVKVTESTVCLLYRKVCEIINVTELSHEQNGICTM